MSTPILIIALKQLKIKKHKERANTILELRKTNTLTHGTINGIISQAQGKFPFITKNGVTFFLRSMSLSLLMLNSSKQPSHKPKWKPMLLRL